MQVLLKDRVAVVTGGGNGIGLATAELFAREGAIIALNDVHGGDCEKAVVSLKKGGHEAIAIPGDAADAAQVGRNVEAVMEKYGRIDILFNNAGIALFGPAEEETLEKWHRVIDVNLNGVHYWAQAVGRASMIPNRSGCIINVASMAGFAAVPNEMSYVASKHGVVGLTKSLAIEWGKYNIRVNCLCPGLTLTPLVESFMAADPEMLEIRKSRVPMKRVCMPDEQAKAALMLASDLASYVSGLIMNVDGGMHALFSGYSIK